MFRVEAFPSLQKAVGRYDPGNLAAGRVRGEARDVIPLVRRILICSTTYEVHFITCSRIMSSSTFIYLHTHLYVYAM